ncbi:MoeA family protein [Mangrovicoccus ximenensis]|uniref:hypothetical protein n=1 Tax=Mangrovicoccus ximenensis TaxID=1911570 RepID=UPI001374B698
MGPRSRAQVVGEAAAGGGHPEAVQPGQAVRIFTGAPVPAGADCIVIQEDTERDGDRITLTDRLGDGSHIRPAGGDFAEGTEMLAAGQRLGPAEIALLAAMNIPAVLAAKKPEVALICTGDELVMPGETPGPSQIVASNAFGLAAMIEAAGGTARMLPIARDTAESLAQCLDLAAGAASGGMPWLARKRRAASGPGCCSAATGWPTKSQRIPSASM